MQLTMLETLNDGQLRQEVSSILGDGALDDILSGDGFFASMDDNLDGLNFKNYDFDNILANIFN